MEMQFVVLDMQEHMGKLTALLKDERRSHQHSCQALLDEAERRAERVRQQQQLEMEQLLQAHRAEISNVVALHTKTLEDERNCAEERYALLEKDYDFLKISFRTYKDSILEEMRSSWLKKENSWKEEQERELLDQLTHSRALLTESEAEQEEQRKAFEKDIEQLHTNYKAEIEGLVSELSEKDATISLWRTALHQTQEQLDVVEYHGTDGGSGIQRLNRRRTPMPNPEDLESDSDT